jgi:tetratricopeptide (TPR) repeat protein
MRLSAERDAPTGSSNRSLNGGRASLAEERVPSFKNRATALMNRAPSLIKRGGSSKSSNKDDSKTQTEDHDETREHTVDARDDSDFHLPTPMPNETLCTPQTDSQNNSVQETASVETQSVSTTTTTGSGSTKAKSQALMDTSTVPSQVPQQQSRASPLQSQEQQQQQQRDTTASWMDISSWLRGESSACEPRREVIELDRNAPRLPAWLAWLDPVPEDLPVANTALPAPTTTSSTKMATPPITQTIEAESMHDIELSTSGTPDFETSTTTDTREDHSMSVASAAQAQPSMEDHTGAFTPIEPNREREREDDYSESASTATGKSKMFGDLASLPSVKDNDTVASSALNHMDPALKDDMTNASSKNYASIVEKQAQDICIPPQNQEQAVKSVADIHLSSHDASVETRRKLLVRELRSTIATYSRYDIKVANVSVALAELLDEAGEHDQAIKLFRDAISIYSSKMGDDHATTISTRELFGQVLENAKLYDEAINTYYLVTVMRRALNGERDPGAADSLVSIARVLRKKSDFSQSIKELKRALKIYRESLGDSHIKVSQTVDEIASLYVTIGDFEKSAAILEEVVKLKAATIGMKSVQVAQTLVCLATTYECSEQFSKSMKSLKKAYKIYTEVGGYSSADSTSTLNKIAQLYEATGDNNRASIAYLGVLRGRKINHGDDHLLVGETYFRLGRTLRETGQTDKALKCMKEALPIYIGKGVEISDVEMIAEIMHEMAMIHKEKGQLNEAARILRQELGVRRKVGQPEFPLIARTLNFLGVIEYEMKSNTKALKYLVEALSIFQQKGEQGIDCAEVLFNAGLVFEASKNQDRALEAFDEAARIFKAHGYKENHPHLVKCYYKIEKLQNTKNRNARK